MATTINEAKQITLLDGTVISARPLKLSLLRKFMAEFDKIAEVAEDNNKSLDQLLVCVKIALQQFGPAVLEGTADLEELLDLPLVYEIVEEASGIKMQDAALLGGIA